MEAKTQQAAIGISKALLTTFYRKLNTSKIGMLILMIKYIIIETSTTTLHNTN